MQVYTQEHPDFELPMEHLAAVFEDGIGSVKRMNVAKEKQATPKDVVNVGEHTGKVIEVVDDIVVQKVGRDPDKVARHAATNLSRVPDIGEVVDIKYRDGLGQVSERAVSAGVVR